MLVYDLSSNPAEHYIFKFAKQNEFSEFSGPPDVSPNQRTLTYLVRGSISVQLTFYFTGLDLARQLNLLLNTNKVAESKAFKQEDSHTVILTLTKCSLHLTYCSQA